MIPLLDLTLDQFENFMGVNIQGAFGSSIWALGLIFLIIVFYILYKMQVGVEGGIILGLFSIYMVTKGFGGQGNLITDAVWYGAAIIGSLIILIWIRRDFGI